MLGFHNLSINRRLVKKLEIGAIIIWLVYFQSVKVPPPFTSSLFNSLSYPLAAALLALHWKRIFYVATRDIILLLLLGVAFASVFWSVNLSATIEANRGLLRTFLLGAYLAACFDLKAQMKILAWVFGISLVLSLVCALAIPSYGIGENGWEGIFLYKNYLGRAMSMAAILFLIFAFNRQKANWLAWLGFSLAIILCLLSHSSSTILFLLVSLSVMPLYLILVKQHYRWRIVFLSLVSALVGFILVLIIANQELILVDILGEGLTFNGRTPIWTLVIEKTLSERPWLGYGYNGFWTSDAGIFVIQNTWASNKDLVLGVDSFNTHNSFLELFTFFGFIGLLIYIMVLFNTIRKIVILLFSTKRIEFLWTFQFILLTIMACLADVGSKFISSSTYGIVGISTCLSIALEYQSIKKKSTQYHPDIRQKALPK